MRKYKGPWNFYPNANVTLELETHQQKMVVMTTHQQQTHIFFCCFGNFMIMNPLGTAFMATRRYIFPSTFLPTLLCLLFH